jgi:hypothetical protein
MGGDRRLMGRYGSFDEMDPWVPWVAHELSQSVIDAIIL